MAHGVYVYIYIYARAYLSNLSGDKTQTLLYISPSVGIKTHAYVNVEIRESSTCVTLKCMSHFIMILARI